jgi:hypothetical protein
MAWRFILMDVLALVGIVVLVLAGYPWWSLLMLLFVYVPSKDKCKCEEDKP